MPEVVVVEDTGKMYRQRILLSEALPFMQDVVDGYISRLTIQIGIDGEPSEEVSAFFNDNFLYEDPLKINAPVSKLFVYSTGELIYGNVVITGPINIAGDITNANIPMLEAVFGRRILQHADQETTQ